MTLFSILLRLSGMSQAEASAFLDISPSSIDKMSRGARATPAGVVTVMRRLIAMQDKSATRHIEQIKSLTADRGAPDDVEIGYPADDHEAQTLGWPSVGAWSAMAARVVAGSDLPVRIVPRGSTLSTAAAIDAREGHD